MVDRVDQNLLRARGMRCPLRRVQDRQGDNLRLNIQPFTDKITWRDSLGLLFDYGIRRFPGILREWRESVSQSRAEQSKQLA